MITTCTAEICSDVGFSKDCSICCEGGLHLDATFRNFRWAVNAALTISAWPCQHKYTHTHKPFQGLLAFTVFLKWHLYIKWTVNDYVTCLLLYSWMVAYNGLRAIRRASQHGIKHSGSLSSWKVESVTKTTGSDTETFKIDWTDNFKTTNEYSRHDYSISVMLIEWNPQRYPHMALYGHVRWKEDTRWTREKMDQDDHRGLWRNVLGMLIFQNFISRYENFKTWDSSSTRN